VANGGISSSYMEHINEATTDLGQRPHGQRGYTKCLRGIHQRSQYWSETNTMWPTGVYQVITWNTSTKPPLIWDKDHVVHRGIPSVHVEYINEATTDLEQIPCGPQGYTKCSRGIHQWSHHWSGTKTMWSTGVYQVFTWNTSTKPLLIWNKDHVVHVCLQSSHMEHINEATTDLGQRPRGQQGYTKCSRGIHQQSHY